MASVFTKIVRGEIPAYKIAEDDKFLAFLDINPVAIGHTLVIPKQEIDYLFDIDDETLAEMIVFAKKVAKALDQAIECKRVGVMVVGTEVPHAHVHLVPFKSEPQVCIVAPKLKLTEQEFKDIAEKIRKYIPSELLPKE